MMLFIMFCHYRVISFTAYNIEKYQEMDINDITPAANYSKVVPINSSESDEEEKEEIKEKIKKENQNKKTRGNDKMIF